MQAGGAGGYGPGWILSAEASDFHFGSGSIGKLALDLKGRGEVRRGSYLLSVALLKEMTKYAICVSVCVCVCVWFWREINGCKCASGCYCFLK